jgi:hypothetical protein
MSTDPRLRALAGLAASLREARLARLQAAEAARRAAAEALAELPAGPELGTDGPAAALVAGARARWIDAERARRTAALAGATARSLEAREHAARALGRAEALRHLAGP